MRKRPLIYILFTLSLVGILGGSYVWEQLPTFPCGKWGFVVSKSKKYYITPEKIVIEPWRGRHQVYGIFMIPDGYIRDHLVTIEIPEKPTYCGILLFPSNTYGGIYAKPGHYLMKGYLQTRTTLELIFEGKINQLKQPSNWKLGYIKEKRK
ncbi:hypothetical protein [Cylindrospermum sp. FACHB-282]|uniref:hypothetical protein n=1 Tax=Cylindrospermum sp. FACHB-282 TaxID=2692794 RepID=UPI001681FBD0|nr:hypothetical protein [Cylindrospermum sp. FACHB-282]MBD2387738.1 hypothetical protein [Cylindrospermum sp. FACHB-282]